MPDLAQRCRGLVLAALALVLLATTGASAQVIIYVDDSAALGGDGSTWPTAYRFLQDALADAASQDNVVRVRVGGGIHRPDESEASPSGTGDRNATFQLSSVVWVRGGYLGLSAGIGEDPDDRDIVANRTFLSGDLLGDDFPPFGMEENVRHVVNGSNTDHSARLEGCTVKGGNADGSSEAGSGGGLFLEMGNPQVFDVRFESNVAADFGGAVHCTLGSSPAIAGCAFTGNVAKFGGAVSSFAGSETTISTSTFTENSATTLGGAVFNGSGSDVTISDSAITDNTAGADGGGIYTSPVATLTLSGTSLCDNTPDNLFGPMTDGGGNSICGLCPADLNGNGQVDFADILAVIGAWGTCTGCAEDLNDNGLVGFDDILVIIGAWGPCS
ncbi:MAG: hypothetical protein GY715_06330 [Planctomycetes bacterium]|nr:hypothetical protein [Planctomycetota bacterium]